MSDEPAFPHFDNRGANNVCKQHNGLTKLEHFAAMAMQGFLAGDAEGYWEFDAVAQASVKQAKALIEALDKEQRE